MKKLAAIRAMPAGDFRLLLDAFVATAMFKFALHLFSIERLRALAAKTGCGRQPVGDLVWAVGVAARWVPGTTCLSLALALQRLLSAHGHASELHIGVAHDGGQFAAHAWVEHDGRILIGEDERLAYTRLLSWQTGRTSPGGRADHSHPG